MTYDPARAVMDGDGGIGARVRALLPPRRLRKGEAKRIAAIVGCSPHRVSQEHWNAQNGRARSGRGKAVPVQPEALTGRLVALDRRQPGLSRKEQARLLGTSHGMVRDTVYRLRRIGIEISSSPGRSRV